MAKKFKCVAPATGLEVGGEYTEQQLNELPGMGGVARLSALEVVVEAGAPAPAPKNPRPQDPPMKIEDPDAKGPKK
jgi:hypothetical protein